MRACECAFLRNRSTVRLRLRDVTFHFFEIDAEYSADETATSIVNVHLRNRVNVKLLYDGGSPIDDVDLAQRNLGITPRHLLEAR
jgi:hypothetical protein